MGKKKSKKVFKMASREDPRGKDDDMSEEEEFDEVSANESFKQEENNNAEDEEDDSQEPNTRKLVAEQNRKKKKSGGFQSMGLSYSVYKGVMKKGYRVPTPIQRKTIPIIMDGKDVVAMARTGSGKTAAFLVPMFERLQQHSAKAGARALILSPTRELALQTMKFCRELGKFSDIKSVLILGGDRMEDQFAKIHENPDIIIATPGRFLHVVVEMSLKLNAVEYVVFDEADRLFEMGFSEQLMEIISRLPDSRQTLLFSATLPKLLVDFARAGLHDPVLIRLDVDTKISEQLKLAFFTVRADDKPAVLLHLLRNVVKATEQTIIFAATRHHVEYLKELLTSAGISASCVYSTLDQTARKINIGKFQNKKTMVLIVTDVAARGIDIPMLDNVINYNFPAKSKLFIHRVGRVARAGRTGTAYSLVGNNELAHMLDLHLFLGRPLKMAPVKDDDDDCVCGSVPQTIIDEEEDFLRVAHEHSSDLETIKKVAANAYKHYLKTRPPPSAESVKRMKEISGLAMGGHPLLGGGSGELEVKRTSMVDGVKNYKPSQTIFEVGNKVKAEAFSIMRKKRNYHSRVIEKNLQQKQEFLSSQSSQSTSAATVPDEDVDIQGVFSKVFHPGMKGKSDTGSTVRDENYIPHQASDEFSEKGLGVKAFEKEAEKVMLDLGGDDQETTHKVQAKKKWDRKRKRFVSAGGSEKKKIKTESGRYIPASYKSNLYKEWMSRNHVEKGGGEEDDEGQPGGRSNFQGKGKHKGKKRTGREGNKKNEIMNKDQILKQRKQKLKLRDKQRSGWERNQKKKAGKGKRSGKGR